MGSLDASLKKKCCHANEDVAFVNKKQHIADDNALLKTDTPLNQKGFSI